jgi:hypothetical protein
VLIRHIITTGVSNVALVKYVGDDKTPARLLCSTAVKSLDVIGY